VFATLPVAVVGHATFQSVSGLSPGSLLSRGKAPSENILAPSPLNPPAGPPRISQHTLLMPTQPQCMICRRGTCASYRRLVCNLAPFTHIRSTAARWSHGISTPTSSTLSALWTGRTAKARKIAPSQSDDETKGPNVDRDYLIAPLPDLRQPRFATNFFLFFSGTTPAQVCKRSD
jgi:hypothetical protein